MATTKTQRIGIWIIAVFMAVGTIGSFAIIVLANSNSQADTARYNELYAQYQKEQTAYTEKTDAQAKELVRLLQHALANHMNVVVHCHAGICRSGAVVEVATMMGFTATDRYRQPNLRVKHKMMKVLGWTYDENEVS